jgi:anti-sigma factor RsiW
MAGCREAMRVLQSYLDGHTDARTTARVGRHLEVCRQCGLEAATYEEIKAALARRALAVDPVTVESLRAFGAALFDQAASDGGPGRPQRPS